MGLGTTVRLLHCDPDVTDSKYGNNLSTCTDKTAYIKSSPRPYSGGSLVHLFDININSRDSRNNKGKRNGQMRLM